MFLGGSASLRSCRNSASALGHARRGPMDTERFDRWVRTLTAPRSRRGALTGLLGGGLSLLGVAGATAKHHKKKHKRKQGRDTSPPPPPLSPGPGCPTCTGKVCGDDGCGGSCGACGACTSCVGGACIPDADHTPCATGPCIGGTCTACGGTLQSC